ncbi:MAG: single-stranded DNA-binding protein [Holosporales bacterium]|jgi:single-strand DNA-binding protein|nr:single-stranded DNA-binding protein [Holosporales bacterium]
MAGSVNKVILVGNLGKDPEIRMTQDGGKFVSFSIATSEYSKDKGTGERNERTEWHRVTVFSEHLVEVVEKYVRKGSKVYLEGQLQTRKWTDQQGIERYSTDIIIPRFRGTLVLLDKAVGAGADTADSSGSGVRSIEDSARESVNSDILDDIPF